MSLIYAYFLSFFNKEHDIHWIILYNYHKLTYIVRDCHSFVYSCYFTNKANSDTSKVEIQTKPKLCHFGRYVAKAKLFRLKSFVPQYPAFAVHMEKDLLQKQQKLNSFNANNMVGKQF